MSEDDFDFGIDFDSAVASVSAAYWRNVAERVRGGHELLCYELQQIGYQAGRERMAEGASLGEAVWAAVPQHCHVGGAVWEGIESGVRLAYGVEDSI